MNYRRLFDIRLGGHKSAADEMDLEIDAHLEMRVADLMRAGRSREAAEREARARFGDFQAAQRQLRSAASQRDAATRRRGYAGNLVADIRYAIRQTRRAPAFTLLAALTLALGIGAAAAMFTLVDHILIHPLPFPHPEALITLRGGDRHGNPVQYVSSADWLDWRAAPSIESSALYSFGYRQGLLVGDSAARVPAERVSSAFFDVLRPRFLVGRGFAADEVHSLAPVAVVSERLWRDLFGADRTLATQLRTANRSYTIIGVVASGQAFPDGTDVWFPVDVTPALDPTRVNVNWGTVARLRDGATSTRATAEINSIARRIYAADSSAIYDAGASTVSLATVVNGGSETDLLLLTAAVAVVLLLVCVNVSAQTLGRASIREREMAVRASIGAERGRLVQQLLIEHVWLASLGGVGGAILGWALVRGAVARWGYLFPNADTLKLDGRALAFTLVVAIGSGVLAGLWPAVRISRVSLRDVLSSGGRTSARGGRNLSGAVLVGAQIAIAVVLLTGAGLLVRSFRAVLGQDLGVDTNVATAEAVLSGPTYATDSVRRLAYWRALTAAYQNIPGMTATAVANWIPLDFTGSGFVDVDGKSVDGGAVYRSVTPGFFNVLRMPLTLGRGIEDNDGAGTTPVAVVNKTLAKTYWPGENPIGHRIRARSMEGGNGSSRTDAPWRTIVGVVADIRTYGLETDPRPEMYVPLAQAPAWRTTGMTVLVHGTMPAARVLGELRSRAKLVDPHIAVDVGTLDDRLRATLGGRRLTMTLIAGFGAFALLLAALGVYGVVSFAVTRRTRELAVRAALGASQQALVTLVFGAGARTVIAGLAVGLVASFALTRFMGSMLFGVTALDPVSYAGALIALLATAAAAILVPAMRAVRLDPAIALQAE